MDALAWITLMSIIVLGSVTWYGVRKEEEDKVLPVLVIGTRNDYTSPGEPAHTVVIRNVGFGPALNSVTSVFASGEKLLQLNHRTSIGPGDTEDVDARESSDGGKNFQQFSFTLGKPPSTRVTLVGDLQKRIDKKIARVCTSYESALGKWYETWQSISVTEQGELAIDFDYKPDPWWKWWGTKDCSAPPELTHRGT
jgi:hypothetical protein